mmetsp:Transcript_18061/g.25459  ORF Transcript_18061/g.25459 Transcript_18061/m.25459 type:complete len:346 (-) Transcript_18061:922-1959(-)
MIFLIRIFMLLTVLLSVCTRPTDSFSMNSQTRIHHAFHHSKNTQTKITYSSLLSSARSSTTTTSDSTTTTATATSVSTLKDQIEEYVTLTDRGRTIKSEEIENTIDALLTNLESYNTLSEPTRSSYTGGSWTVGYTTAPPPSNGQLGPFRGIAQQVIDMEGRTYKNVLIVPPNDWLKASLDAVWEEWDGTYIEDDEESISKWTGNKKNNKNGQEESDTSSLPKQVAIDETIQQKQGGESSSSAFTSILDGITGIFTGGGKQSPTSSTPKVIDYGATCWRVTFEQLTISIFGTPIFTKKFDEGTQRIWRTTYLDENTRIVRAGRTGLPDDEIPFYMTRTTPTTTTS